MIVPFYSDRTLREVHELVEDLSDGMAVYIDKEGSLATIGTRGARPGDGAAGLIIHLHATVNDDGSIHMYKGGLVEPCYHNLHLTPVAPAMLFDLLVTTLREAGRLKP